MIGTAFSATAFADTLSKATVSLTPTFPPNTALVNEPQNVNVLTVDKEFTIDLLSYSTAGYTWMPKFDDSYLYLKKKTVEPYSLETVGGASVEKFVFIPIKIGETDIVMLQKRPWEDKIVGKKTFHIIITSNPYSMG